MSSVLRQFSGHVIARKLKLLISNCDAQSLGICCAVLCIDWGSTCSFSPVTCSATLTLLMMATVRTTKHTGRSKSKADGSLASDADLYCAFLVVPNAVRAAQEAITGNGLA